MNSENLHLLIIESQEKEVYKFIESKVKDWFEIPTDIVTTVITGRFGIALLTKNFTELADVTDFENMIERSLHEFVEDGDLNIGYISTQSEVIEADVLLTDVIFSL